MANWDVIRIEWETGLLRGMGFLYDGYDLPALPGNQAKRDSKAGSQQRVGWDLPRYGREYRFFFPSSEQTKQNKALVEFIKKVKQQHNISVAQNWGFHTLMNYTAPYVDFIMWEDFSYRIVGEDEWSLEMMEELQKVREEHGTQVMAVGFTGQEKSRELAEKNGFKFVFNPAGSYYNEW